MSYKQTFNEEFGYLCYKYFGHTVRIEPYYTYSNIIMYINNIPYEYYRFNNNMEVMIPSYDEVLLDGDFDNIYILQATEPTDFTFRVINKKDGIVKTRDYNYHNINGKINTAYSYNEIDDFNNEFKKLYEESGLSFEQFVIRNYFENIEDANEIISSSIMNKDNLSEIMDATDNKKYKKISKKKQLLMEFNEELAINQMKNKTKKIK